MMDYKKVSIVICTYNRASYLARTLDSLNDLSYNNFEVIVVNGPSTDESIEILQLYKYKIKIRSNPERNLSISRNIGIKASSGEIIALIDDDAIPDPNWLDDILSYYTDDSIGGVGGKVYGPGGNHFQFTNGIIDIWGKPETLRQTPGDYNNPNGTVFNIMMGTNSTFSRKALLEIGGFDEYYEYYHDESDVDVRLIKRGYKILHHPCAYIHHEFAKSHIRKSTYNINWYPIGKNTVYFGIKNSEGYGSIAKRKDKVLSNAKKKLKEFEYWLDHGFISQDEYLSFIEMWNKGCEKGLSDSLLSERRLSINLDSDSDFLLFNTKNVGQIDNKLSICMLCQDDPIDQVGGVAKYTWQLATGYAKDGHSVHILTKAEIRSNFNEKNIYLHKIPECEFYLPEIESYPITKKNIVHSYSSYMAIKDLNEKYNFDIIEAPTWDFEGVVPAKLLDIPVITRLQTPMLKAAETQKWVINDDIKLASDFERCQFALSSGIIAISENIKDTIAGMYGINFSNMLIQTIFLGVEASTGVPKKKSDNHIINILFVGRLERRKGIHILLEIIPEILNRYSNVAFTLVGDDTIPDESGVPYKSSFLNKHSKDNFANRVKFKGKVDNNELKECYQNCDIFVSPSLYESFGIIFIEAMRYGKPVIGGKAGGMQEIIVDGETGFLAEPNNSDDLKNKLVSLIEDQDLRNKMGEKAYERYNLLFTPEVMCNKSIEFYKSVILNKFSKRLGRKVINSLVEDILRRKQPYRLPKDRIRTFGWEIKQLDDWNNGETLMSSKKGAYIEFDSQMSVLLKMLQHSWSGKVDIICDGKLIERVDLFTNSANKDFSYKIQNKDYLKHTYRIEVTGEKSSESQGCEVWVEGIYEY